MRKPNIKYRVTLAEDERKTLKNLVRNGNTAGYRIRHAQILLALDVKLIFGMAELNKLLVQVLMSVIVYMIILTIFPTLMKTILTMTMRFAKESI